MQTLQIKPFKIIGISIRTTNENDQSGEDIAELWQRFMQENILEKIPNKLDHTVYSLYTNYESDHTKPYTTILGCKVSHLEEIPQGMVGKQINDGTYLKITSQGDLNQGLIYKQWTEIFNMNLDRTFDADFEAYGEKAQNPSNAEVDFYIGINNE